MFSLSRPRSRQVFAGEPYISYDGRFVLLVPMKTNDIRAFSRLQAATIGGEPSRVFCRHCYRFCQGPSHHPRGATDQSISGMAAPANVEAPSIERRPSAVSSTRPPTEAT